MKNPREAECLVTPESFAEKQVNLRGLFFGVTVMDVEGEIYKNLEFTIWLWLTVCRGKWPIEIDGLPMKNIKKWWFSMAMLVTHNQMVTIKNWDFTRKKKDVFWTNKVGTIFLGDLSIKHVNVDVSNVSIGI